MTGDTFFFIVVYENRIVKHNKKRRKSKQYEKYYEPSWPIQEINDWSGRNLLSKICIGILRTISSPNVNQCMFISSQTKTKLHLRGRHTQMQKYNRLGNYKGQVNLLWLVCNVLQTQTCLKQPDSPDCLFLQLLIWLSSQHGDTHLHTRCSHKMLGLLQTLSFIQNSPKDTLNKDKQTTGRGQQVSRGLTL